MTNGNAYNTQGSGSRRVKYYPQADVNTSQLVTKLRSRSSASQKPVRTESEALMQNVYKTVPQKMMPRANVREVGPVLNSNYSEFSDVNMKAAREAKARETEMNRQRGNMPQYRSTPQQRSVQQPVRQTRPANARPVNGGVETPKVNKAQPVKNTERRVNPANRAVVKAPVNGRSMTKREENNTVSVRFNKPDAMSQIPESGPREAVYRKLPFPKLVILVVMLSLILFLMVQSIVKNFEYRNEIAELQGELDAMSVRESELKLELEQRDDLAELEERAEAIGMIKDGKVEEKYISLEYSDVVENFGEEDDGYGSFTTMLSAVSRRLSRFLGGEE